MKILVTHPGKIGDCFWALPTARAIAESYGEKVDFMSSAGFTSHLPLIQAQPYIARAGYCAEWEVQNTAPMTPVTPPPEGKYVSFTSHRGASEGLEFGEVPLEVTRDYDRVFHLGYPAWPTARLAEYVYQQALQQNETGPGAAPSRVWTILNPLDLSRPWIVALSPDRRRRVAVGFTDEWAELKAGLLGAAEHALPGSTLLLLAPPGGSRLDTEWSDVGCPSYRADWVQTANLIAGADLFLGCLSSQAVLAMALGIPRVLVEPNPHRHHEIFQHPDCPLVLGNDGKPTFDARHVADALREKLQEVK